MRKINQKSNKLCYVLLYIAPIILSLFILSNNTFTNASALEYQSNINVQFTFNPTISINISDNLVIDNLSPGTAKDSNVINVNIATNNVTGYTLSATVGTNSTDTKLTNTTSSSSYFTNLTTNKSELSDFTDNTWGYSYSVDNGTNWISGDNTINSSTSASNASPGYNGLPLDTNTTASERGKNGITLISTDTAADSKVIKFKIGARASSTQAAGTYTNTINFYAVSKIPLTSFYDAFNTKHAQLYNGYYAMQDMDTSICNAVELIGPDSVTALIDKRDGTTYKIAKLQDNNCWMLDNLALDLTNTDVKAKMYDSANPNHDTLTNATNTELGYLFNGGGTTTDQYPTAKLNNVPWTSADQNYYSVPMIATGYKDTLVTSYGPASTNGQAKVGIYYNYCAASAGTYCWGNGTSSAGSPSTDPKPDTLIDIDGDVCPTNWRIPTSTDDGEYYILCSAIKGSECSTGDSATIMDAISSSSMQYQLSTSLSGQFGSGSDVDRDAFGHFWSSTYGNTYSMGRFRARPTDVVLSQTHYRYRGDVIRCLVE